MAASGDPLIAEAIRAGARGCVSKAASPEALARAVLAAARGNALLSDEVPERLSGRAARTTRDLTKREHQVRVLLELALPDKEIAQRLAISPKTVEKHVGAILRKMGAWSRTEVVALSHAGRGGTSPKH